MRYIIGIMLLVISTLAAATEELPTKADVKMLTESVMKDVSKDKIKDGLMRLRSYWIYPVSEFDTELGKIDLQLSAINQRFGSSIGFEFLDEENVGESLTEYVYIQKFERHVMVWHFIFYKPKDKWVLDSWYFNDQVKPLFKYHT